MAWANFRPLYTILVPKAQWELHRFYQPAEDMTKEQLVVYRKALIKQVPALSCKAGKHFNRMYYVFRLAFEMSKGNERKFREAIRAFTPSTLPVLPDKRRIRVTSIVNPEPDLRLLARALIELEIGRSPLRD
jgi:hypothetical protein